MTNLRASAQLTLLAMKSRVYYICVSKDKKCVIRTRA